MATKVLVMLATRKRSAGERGAPVRVSPTPAVADQTPWRSRAVTVAPGTPAATAASTASRVRSWGAGPAATAGPATAAERSRAVLPTRAVRARMSSPTCDVWVRSGEGTGERSAKVASV